VFHPRATSFAGKVRSRARGLWFAGEPGGQAIHRLPRRFRGDFDTTAGRRGRFDCARGGGCAYGESQPIIVEKPIVSEKNRIMNSTQLHDVAQRDHFRYRRRGRNHPPQHPGDVHVESS